MTATVLVTGGTGTLGRLVVGRLRKQGCDVRVLSPRHHEATDDIEFFEGDLASGEGIDPAVEGVTTVVHCAGSSKGDEDKAQNLVLRGAAGRQLLGVPAECNSLTRRESEILGLLVHGLAGRQIARELAISLLTVNGHLKSTYRKCGVTGRDELFGRRA